MDVDNPPVHRQHMEKNKRVKPRQKREPRPNCIRQWRKFRGLTLERLAERLGTSHATLSRVERGLQDYDETLLWGLSEALGTDIASLLIRDPTDPEGIWSIWDQAQPGQRKQIVEVARTLLKTG